jgi:hypothetical protein
MVPLHTHQNTLHSAVGQTKIKSHMLQSHISVHLKDFLDACTVAICHQGASSPLRLLSVTLPWQMQTCGTIWQTVTCTSHHCSTFLRAVNGYQLGHFPCPQKLYDSWDFRVRQVFRADYQLNCRNCAPSVYMHVTWLWKLEPSLTHIPAASEVSQVSYLQ